MGETLTHRRNWREKLVEELRAYAIISAYFFVCFSAILIYKAVLLRESGVDFFPLSAAAVKALILGKFALVASGLPIRMKSESQAVLFKLTVNTALLFIVLMTLSILEEFIVGRIHGQAFAAILTEYQGALLDEKLAGALLMLLVLLPAVGVAELSQALGPGKLKKILLSDSAKATNP
jgi:hypothetical protein